MVAAVFIVDQSPCVLPTQVAEGRGHHVTVICVTVPGGSIVVVILKESGAATSLDPRTVC